MSLFLGIELGSTRIKAIAADKSGKQIASGTYDWENKLEDGVWTYHLDDVWKGLRGALQALVADFDNNNSIPMQKICGIGISAMMHGYLVFDKTGRQLTGFRTWRNTMTEEQATYLSKLFGFNIPQRWSIAHLYRAITASESHVKDIDFMTTLAGYVHYKLTGRRVAGICEASGMFPVDSKTGDYDTGMMEKFDAQEVCRDMPWKLRDILPQVLMAGENAGELTQEGASLLDPTGELTNRGILTPGILLCPPEGDAATGMVATNALAANTGNVSAGTSIFAMLVLDKALSKPHPQIDMVTTPTGRPVALVHGNNCTADLDAWLGLFSEVLERVGGGAASIGGGAANSGEGAASIGGGAANSGEDAKTALYKTLYNAALQGDPDCGGLVSVGYLSGEHMTGFEQGRPLFVRTTNSTFNVPNFMRSLLYSSMATLRIGMDILKHEEGVTVTKLLAHGGLFKTPVVAQKLMADALETPVAVMDSAGEGGAWGIALLCVYCALKEPGETLEDFLDAKIFAGAKVSVITPDSTDSEGFAKYMETFKKALKVEQTAVKELE